MPRLCQMRASALDGHMLNPCPPSKYPPNQTSWKYVVNLGRRSSLRAVCREMCTSGTMCPGREREMERECVCCNQQRK